MHMPSFLAQSQQSYRKLQSTGRQQMLLPCLRLHQRTRSHGSYSPKQQGFSRLMEKENIFCIIDILASEALLTGERLPLPGLANSGRQLRTHKEACPLYANN